MLVVPTIENGEELCIRVCYSFFVHAKSGTTNNDRRTGLNDISYYRACSRDSNHINSGLKFMIFCQKKRAIRFTNASLGLI